MSEGSDSDTPPKTKKRLRIFLNSSASDSDSDDSIETIRRKKRLRIVSEEDVSDSSGSSIVLTSRRPRTLPRYQSDGSDFSEWISDHSVNDKCKKSLKNSPDTKMLPAKDYPSDSSEGNSDKCPICLLSFSSQEIGTPETCEHIFCLDCITEWSKNVNTCPVDRLTFDSIVVRSCLGGRILRKVPVIVNVRRPSVEMLVEEDPTFCEICGTSDREDTMLLCDRCDLGYHMQCLSPPLEQVPLDQWFCPHCSPPDSDEYIYISEVDDLLADFQNIERPTGPRASRLRESRDVRRSSRRRQRNNSEIDLNEPSTSSGQYSQQHDAEVVPRMSSSRRKVTKTPVRRRKYTKRRRTRTVFVEYEIKDGEKFPIKKKSTRRVKKRKIKKRRAPRTVARRSLVRASVRARLATLRGVANIAATGSAYEDLNQLAVKRYRAGIPSLNLFGSRHDLEYFSDDETNEIGDTLVSVAHRRSTSVALDAYRQARRKQIQISSPPPQTSMDILSNIMESQSLLHSKNTLVSIAIDGTVNIKLQTQKKPSVARKSDDLNVGKTEKVDISKSGDLSRKVPSYPGAARGGGWNGGSRGGYREQNYRDQGRGGQYGGNSFSSGGGHQSSGNYQGNSSYHNSGSWQNNSAAHSSNYNNGDRRRDQYPNFPDRPMPSHRMPPVAARGRGQFPRLQGRHSTAPDWQPFSYDGNQSFPESSLSGRHSFGAFEDPLDMTVNQNPPDEIPVDIYGDIDESGADRIGVASDGQTRDGDPPRDVPPLPEPPVFRFEKPTLSEDERSDSGLVIDTEKYDPMDPTHDDSSGDGSTPAAEVQSGTGHDDEGDIGVPATVLDNAVQQVLQEHRSYISTTPLSTDERESDGDESDGDCPNYSIYSTTSLSIANNTDTRPTMVASEAPASTADYEEKEEDLIQEEDDIPMPEDDPPVAAIQDETRENIMEPNLADRGYGMMVLDDEKQVSTQSNATNEYSEKVSKRCPITPNKRTPIKITLTSNSLIKRHVLDLYAEEEEEGSEDFEELPAAISVTKPEESEEKSIPESESSPMESIVCGQELNDEVKDLETCVEIKQIEEENLYLPPENKDETPVLKSTKYVESIDKMTESISESEDERSYTPCLDENKSKESKDTSFENEKENILEGLDTEMISEDEGNEIFSDPSIHKGDLDGGALEISLRDGDVQAADFEEGEIVEKKKEQLSKSGGKPEKDRDSEDDKKKKKREKKQDKEAKDKSKVKSKKITEIAFKKLSKSGKERNYRDKDDKNKSKVKDRRKSTDKENRDRAKDKKKEKRKDLERYDVRTIVSEKRRRVKDAFGRDTSRPRSKSPSVPRSSSRGRSFSRNRRSLSDGRYTPSISRKSPRKSLSRGRRSFSRIRKSPSLGRRSFSPRGKSPSLLRARRSLSQRGRRSISHKKRKSLSPRKRSISPRRRSLSHRGRRSISPRLRRSVTPRNRRSLSKGRKRIRKSLSRDRIHRSKSPRRKISRRSRSRLRSLSRKRSRSPKKRTRRPKYRTGSPKRKTNKVKKARRRSRSRSFTPELVLSPAPIRERMPNQVWRVPDKSPLFQDWSSDSPSLNSRLLSPSWTPPRAEKSPDRRNLRVILTTKDKSKKKERKKKIKETEKVLKHSKHASKEMGPSKEVFTSGNNILVSVSFNKNEQNEGATAPDSSPKRKKRKGESRKDKNKDKTRKKKNDRKKDTENKKPVAIIDLDKSPFRELTPSPKNVIVLSDSEHGEKEEELIERQQLLRGELHQMNSPNVPDIDSPITREPQFLSSGGPKTPPEPSIKFSIMSKTSAQLRPANPLHEEEDENQESGENEQTEENRKESIHKGPNTPPDPPNSPPSSPDAYDPFEPTKSGSVTPERAPSPTRESAALNESEALDKNTTITLETAQKTNLSADDVLNARPITPIEKVMALLQSTRNVSPTDPNAEEDVPPHVRSEDDSTTQGAQNNMNQQSPDRTSIGVIINKAVQPQSHFSAVIKPNSPKPIYSTVIPTIVTSAPIYLNAAIPRIGAFTTNAPSPRSNSSIQVTSQRIVLPSPTKSSPLKNQPAKLFLAKPSPIKSTPIKPMPSKTIISKLPLPNVKPLGPRRNVNKSNGKSNNDIIDLDFDMDSPYSPGSSDFGDLFEPPSDKGNAYSKALSKGDTFDSLFPGKGGNANKARNNKASATKVPVKQIKKKGKAPVGIKLDEDNLKILDDLPSSAVEMQVKSKFLKKLNRQERVVEEVKLVLKPHYNKKHVTKEEYKEILRRAVPKICHNRSGEINPAKIQALVEAYVKKFRKKVSNK